MKKFQLFLLVFIILYLAYTLNIRLKQIERKQESSYKTLYEALEHCRPKEFLVYQSASNTFKCQERVP